MASFYINLKNLNSTQTRIQEVGKTIVNVRNTVIDVSNGISNIGLGEMKAPLAGLERALTEKNKSIDMMHSALDNILSLYKKTEELLSNNRESLFDKWRSYSNSLLRDKPDGTTKSSPTPNSTDDNQEYTSPTGTNYTIGDAKQPDYQYDDDFPYDPNAIPTKEDFKNYKKWKRNARLADNFGWIKGISDAGDAYYHYMNGNGEDFEIDFEGAYNEDDNIQAAVDFYVNDLQHTVDEMIANGQKPPFSITGDLIPISGGYYPETENWQKTIGAFNMWISADVSVDSDGNIVMETTVHEIDRYNFNKDSYDIATGTPDEINGRFEELGWAHSFTTTGEMDLNVTWAPGDVPDADSAHYGDGGR